MTAQADTGTPVTSAPGRAGAPEWWDRLIGSDPGLMRLRQAVQAVVTIAIAMLAERLLVGYTHALQIDTHGAALPPAQAAKVAAQHHGMLVIAIMLGAMVGMMSSFMSGMFKTGRERAVSFGLMPVFMVGGLALGLSVAQVPSRAASLATLVVLLALGAYCRRFGPLGFMGGNLVFMGDFFGFFLNSALGLGDLGWITVEICLSVVVAAIGQFTIFRPRPRVSLRRLRRSFEARATTVVHAALDLLDETGTEPTALTRASRRLHRRLVRLNETALMVDAQLDDPRSVPAGTTPAVLHQMLFDAELAVTNMARFAEQMARYGLPAEPRARVSEILRAVGGHDRERADQAAYALLEDLRSSEDGSGAAPVGEHLPDDQKLPILLHRFAISALGFLEAVGRGEALTAQADGEPEEFRTEVATVGGGWLPGSSALSADASEAKVSANRWALLQPWRHVAIPSNVRVMIQMTVAVGAAVVLGSMLSERRFYWAVIAAFVTFMGTNNTGEQIRKGGFRVLGTAVGVLLGGVLAHLVGRHTYWAIGVILVALFVGIYLMRVSYAFMVVGITIMVSQLYVQMDEYTNSLLLLRLGETALGAALAALVVLFVLPLRTSVVARLGAQSTVQALGDVIDAATAALLDPGSARERNRLRAATRALDEAYQSFVTTVSALRTPFTTDPGGTPDRFQHATAAARHYARSLLADIRYAAPLSEDGRDQLRRAQRQLSDSLTALVEALSAESSTTEAAYVRAAALFDAVPTEGTGLDPRAGDPRQFALRDLQLLDGALATLAETVQMPVRALDAAAHDSAL